MERLVFDFCCYLSTLAIALLIPTQAFAETPLIANERSDVLAALSPSSSSDSMIKALVLLKIQPSTDADPLVVEAIRKNLKHKDDKVPTAAED